MSRSDELRALAQRLADAFPAEAIEVVVTGSVSRGLADELSDIEMLVVTEEPLSLEQAFALAAAAGLEDRDSWGDPSTPTRRVHGYVDGQSVETIWWSREFAEEQRWGGFSPGGLLTIARPDTALARAEWLVESAQRVLAIVFALNRVHQPTTKRLAARVEPLSVKPDRVAERIDGALAEPDPRTALRLLTELQLEMVQLAPSGPNVDRARTWLAEALELL